MIPIRIGGVPEHFNMPWHWSRETGLFQKDGIELVWKDFPGGTGAMNKALRDNELDMAIVLTEGAITDIVNGNPSKMVGWYVCSPLVWGIHVSANSDITDVGRIKDKKYAISRKGSGSHLMGQVDASQRNFHIKEEQWVIVNHLDGAAEALFKGEADIFLWEKFTTKPLVDKGLFRRIGECPTPWPCFVIVVRNDFYKANKSSIQDLLNTIQNEASKFKNLPSSIQMISTRYGFKPEDVNDWMKTVEWADNQSAKIQAAQIKKVADTLATLGFIPKEFKDIDQLYTQ